MTGIRFAHFVRDRSIERPDKNQMLELYEHKNRITHSDVDDQLGNFRRELDSSTGRGHFLQTSRTESCISGGWRSARVARRGSFQLPHRRRSLSTLRGAASA